MTPAPTLSPAPSVSVAPSLSLPPALGANCIIYPHRNGTLDIAAESSVVLGKGINIDAKAANKFWAVFAGNGVAESKYGVALLASDRTAVTMCNGHFQGGTNRFQNGMKGFDMGGPGYLQMACGSILAGNSYSDYVPSPALILEDTLFESIITGGNIIGGYWPKADNDWIDTPLSVHVNIFGANFVGNWNLYPKSEINVYGYDLELSEENEMPCPSYFNSASEPEVDTTTCKVLTGYLCDDSPIKLKVRFLSRENSMNYKEFNTKGEVNRFNNVNCKKVVPEIVGCGMQKCKKKSAKSGKQLPKKSDKSGKENMFG